MTAEQIVLWAVVLAAACSARFNWTAGALSVAWLCSEFIAWETGNPLLLEFYLYPDFFVIGIIAAKAVAVPLDDHCYRSEWHRLRCLFTERPVGDRIILAIYPAVWFFYVADIHEYYRWWALYYLTLAQFLAAVLEAFITYRRTRAVRDTPGKPPSDGFQFAWAVRGYG